MSEPSTTSLFGSTELVARIERAEARTMADGAAAARAREPAAEALALGGGYATWAAPGSPLNKVVGLGFGPTPTEAEIEAMERFCAERETPVRVELATLAEEGQAARFTARGYQLAGFENVLGLPIDGASPLRIADGVEVEAIGPEQGAVWLDVVVRGFAAPDDQGVASDEQFPREVLEQAIDGFTGMPGFRRYLARLRGELAGGASMRLVDGIAQLSGAATLPAHRRRGVQTSLLAARLATAREAGCDLAIVTTQPGSKSQENVQRMGFQLLYARAVLVRERAD
ncbi:MAG: GNAT family N-acetyltransferase [Holophagales bacterium]|nr:GNAT family N-acetyltransferase [Holophagales bacterium]